MDPRYASRKFILCCTSLLASWIAFPCGLITADQVLEFTTWVLGLYLAANVGQKAVIPKVVS